MVRSPIASTIGTPTGRCGRPPTEDGAMDFKLELVAVPVTDVDRAKRFYTEQAGFNADHDHNLSDELRFVQLTPPGSAFSIALGPRVPPAPPAVGPRARRGARPPPPPGPGRCAASSGSSAIARPLGPTWPRGASTSA